MKLDARTKFRMNKIIFNVEKLDTMQIYNFIEWMWQPIPDFKLSVMAFLEFKLLEDCIEMFILSFQTWMYKYLDKYFYVSTSEILYL